MLKYLVILLSDRSLSFCNYKNNEKKAIISENDLKEAIHFAMKENLMIQFVFPKDEIPVTHKELIESVYHVKIMNFDTAGVNDIGIVESWEDFGMPMACKTIIVRTSLSDLIGHEKSLIERLSDFSRINVVITDVCEIREDDATSYGKWLKSFAADLCLDFDESNAQLNILTDRLMLDSMKNCNAGIESLTVAPDGQFYICPGFYYSGAHSVGNTSKGVVIPNRRLLEFNNAPICRECDAWHCRRCIYLNYKFTHEVNTPGRMQCVLSHMERNASKIISDYLNKINNHKCFIEIPEIDYIDPFDKLA